MILRANKLGVQVNGNILRIATVDSLAKEAETEKVISEAKLENTVLVTEFIRLNYARGAGGGGSTGNFAGGATPNVSSLSSSSAAGSTSAPSAGGDQGVLPIMQPRLSERG